MSAIPRAPAFQRHRFAVEQAGTLQATGALGHARIEVIDGDLIDMPDDGPLHRRWTGVLTAWLTRSLAPDAYVVLPNTTLRLSASNGPSPDFHQPGLPGVSAALDEADVDGGNVLLVIEQSDTSLDRDLGDKQALYATFGVRDYWDRPERAPRARPPRPDLGRLRRRARVRSGGSDRGAPCARPRS